MTGFPGRIYFLIIESRLSFPLEGTGTKKHLLISRSIPPKIHYPSVIRPLYCFLHPFLASSVLTILLIPPIIGADDLITEDMQTSLIKLHQSTHVCLDIPSSLHIILSLGDLIVIHNTTNLHIIYLDRFAFSNQDPLLIETFFVHFLFIIFFYEHSCMKWFCCI